VVIETFLLVGFLRCFYGEVKLKEWKCVEIKHHKDIGRTIEEYERKGWRLHTYQTAGMGAGPMAYNVNHYLLFEKGE
jgi:hypothetical protein